ncbi:MAG TPA: nucleotide sugar dehydrogenase [Hyphomicrobiaceae bacterium]|nr:nucleotide sugar dehydrogenase [Hyphomicrobiaceae bacterium]
MGLGYVGLPLAAAIARVGFRTIGFDVDATKIAEINAATSYIDAVSDTLLDELVQRGSLRATMEFSELTSCDVIIICVPTPLTRHREPDLSFIRSTAQTVARYLRSGQLVVLESTTYPGTTTEVLKPILEGTGLRSGADFFIGFSPEREDPGNASFETVTIPKVVAGDGPVAKTLMEGFYGAVVRRIVPVSSTDVAEAVKITENVFRAVNIALVNELKVIYDAMGIDVWEVIEAASTKPFGYMPFYPGPGLGGHCIPIDPFYLTWKSREHELTTRFIELAGEINLSMPRYVVSKLESALDARFARSLGRARILMVGLAYKKNVADIRESPSLKLIELIERRGARVDFHDPHVAAIPPTRAYPEIKGRKSVDLTPAVLGACDAVLVVTDHDTVDYALVAEHARLVIDTRNVFRRKGIVADHIMKA